jgi:geranylgeranyl diphosphate synthase type II
MNNKLNLIENALFSYLPSKNVLEKNLIDSMEYSLKAGGKRVRPMLALEFCELCGGDIQKAVPFGCAVEMIHTYSLIHDDLPCMDDDDLRRGKPSNHIVYGEDIALLAGDALQTLAFDVISKEETVNLSGATACVKASNTLAKYAGALGMVGGQVIDLEHEDKQASIDILSEMDIKKTSGLIKASCEMGCIAAGADDKKINSAGLYGEYIGVAFQIVDDILDVTSSVEELGKPVGSDESNQKSTYVSLLGIDKCKELVADYTQKAIDALDVFEGNKEPLIDFAVKLANRKN